MRFVCDEHVVAPALKALRGLGHEAWTAQDAGLTSGSDEDLAVYAADRNAILVTHDREFSGWRRGWLIGHHIRLRCREREAAGVLTQHLPDCYTVLGRDKPVWISMTTHTHEVRYPRPDELR